MNMHGVPGAKVTLYTTIKNGTKYRNKEVTKVDGNPQYTTSGLMPGSFLFNNVSQGTYNITVEKDNKMTYSIINVKPGMPDVQLILNDYVYTQPIVTPIPTAIPPSPTPAPPPPYHKPIPTPEPSGVFSDTLVKPLLMLSIGAQFIIGVLAFVMYSVRRL
jgi:hypothetical protein